MHIGHFILAGLAMAAPLAASAANRLDLVAKQLADNGFSGEILTSTGERHVIALTAPARWVFGSVTKQIMAVAAARLVEEGKVRWDDTIAARLPAFAGHPRGEVTLKELFLHTSGLAVPEAGVPEDAVPPYLARRSGGGTDEALATGLCAGPPAGERGTFRYNNCDTIVAGAMLVAASGEPLPRLIARTVLRPAGMRHTRLARFGERVAFSGSGDRIEIAGYGAAAALLGTADDLIRFDAALMTGKLINAQSRATLWQGEPALGYAAPGAWAFPADLAGCKDAVPVVERRGEVDGIQVRNLMAPTLGRALVVFTPVANFDFGEIWQGRGASFALASAAFCD